jgi:hypothetical protein
MATREEYRGYTITLDYDELAESSREWDNLFTMVCWHRRYILGDEQLDRNLDPWDYMMSKLDEIEVYKLDEATEELLQRYGDNEDITREEIRDAFDKYFDSAALYLFDHSGISISLASFNDPWDSGQVGFLYASKDALREEFGKDYTPERVRELMEGEVDTYDQYLRGDVYCYSISKDGDDLDSCCGFYGEEYALEEARSMVDWLVEKDRKQHQEQVKTFIRHHVPLERRVT